MITRSLDVAALQADFARAEPFPHVVLDGLLERRFLVTLGHALAAHELVRQAGRVRPFQPGGRRLVVADPAGLPEPVQQLAAALRAPRLLATLGAIAGIPDLRPDGPLPGDGLLLLARGGRLRAGGDRQPDSGPDPRRRLQLIVALNPLWEEDWGGEVELYERAGACRQRVLPVLGRCVLLETDSQHVHGTSKVRAPRGLACATWTISYASSAEAALVAQPRAARRPRAEERVGARLLTSLPRQHVVGWQLSRLWQRLRERRQEHGRPAS